jgi:RNA polymerase sigma factor (sigma-70 family)
MSQTPEQILIAGCKRKDRIYQEQLYKLYYSLFLKICIRYAKNKEDAEQLVHDGFIKIFNSIDQYQFTGSFEGWMKKIVVNLCLDYIKSKKIKEENLTTSADALPENLSDFVNYEDIIAGISFKELLDVIHELPLMSRTVFNLYVLDGFTHKQISERLEISEGTSSWHLHHARSFLKQKLKNLSRQHIKGKHHGQG